MGVYGGLLWRLISTRLHTLQSLPLHFFDGNTLGSGLSSKSNSTNFPAIWPIFPLTRSATKREAHLPFKLHWHKQSEEAGNKSTKVNVLHSAIWRHNWNVCLSVFISGYISPTSKLDSRDKLKCFGEKCLTSIQMAGQIQLHRTVTFPEKARLQLWRDLVRLWGNPTADVIIWVLKDSYFSFSYKWQGFDHIELLMRLNFYVNS